MRELVNKILALNWAEVNPEKLAIVSYYCALEFAECLRNSSQGNLANPRIHKLSLEELNTDNLQFGSYGRKADHAEFLCHFLVEEGWLLKYPELVKLGESYVREVTLNPHRWQFDTVVSREEELSGIFHKILNSGLKLPDWLRYFYERHLELDHVHAGLVSIFVLSEKVLTRYYALRLEFYQQALLNRGE
ncbi:MAG TPA: hypothetical protein VEA59_02090 [Patescibacteria group bacterium]|nr:hypothetical protein [Patescibacteria group bacterium]